MKIAQVVCVYPPYRGGIGTMSYNHSKSLVAAGHEVHVFTLPFENEPEYKNDSGVHVHRMKPFFSFGNAGIYPHIAKELKDFDIVHLHYPFFGTAEFVIAARKTNPKWKLVTTYHMDVKGNFALRPFFFVHRTLFLSQVVKTSHAVIVTSNDYAAHSQIAKYFYSIPGKFHEIPPEVDTSHFVRTLDSIFINEKHGLEPHTPVLLFVGGLNRAHYFKGVEFLLRSFKLLLDSSEDNTPKLLLVGSGDLQQQYETTAVTLGIADHVIFAGNVSYDDLPKYYSRASATILPSIDKSEAFGIVLIESMSCGTPVVTSLLPGVRTVATQGISGYTFPVKNEGKCAAILRDIINQGTADPALIRSEAIEKYDSEVILQKLIEVYHSTQS